ncbi:MAG: alpha/beta hydrolase [Ferrovum sp.]|nr:alpha/beta hydrolase [Ferrovum sp.]
MTSLVFVHGWAMGPDLWSPITGRLPGHSMRQANLGFIGLPNKPVVRTPLVVAHSLGLMWALINLPRPWAGLVSINGFTRFTCSDNFPGIETRFIERMKSRLLVDMNGVVEDFLRRCGSEFQNTQSLDQAMLSKGLEWLVEWDTRAQFSQIGCPVLAISGKADPIVTEAHSLACFSDVPLVTVKSGGHLLPRTHADWLALRIAAALEGDWSI